ncbi:MAG: UDP-N-acetylmuramoyl-tripeptide--D-alanyl-D-alanine ligase [Gemmatimonadaceae bacterium]
MSFWTVDRVSQALADEAWGALPRGSTALGNVSTDTRSLHPGDIFVALRGERFDAHDFLREALSRGAGLLVVADPARTVGAGVPVLAVHDTLAALGALGRFRRRAWSKPIVAIAGSNGKSSTKELVRAALGVAFDVHATEGNLNNFIGVPLTLLEIPDAADVAVVEIGTNRPGEVDVLRSIVEPDVAVVTSIGEEHLEGLGDLAGVLAEESAVYRGVPLAIAPASQPEVGTAARALAHRTVEAGLDQGDLRADAWGLAADGAVWLRVGESQVTLPLRGAHNARNAMLALAVADAFGIPRVRALDGLSRMTPLPMRGAWEQLGTLSVINDAYNANPASAREAITLLDGLDATRPHVIVLGSMLELGEHTAALHREIAERAVASNCVLVAGVGEFVTAFADVGGRAPRVLTAPDLEQLWQLVQPHLPANAIVMLKGSRGARLERLMPRLRGFAGLDESGAGHAPHP